MSAMREEGENSLRYVALWTPNWSLSSLVVQVPPGAPAAVFREGRVHTLTPPARKVGVRVGMPQKMANYLCPDLLTYPFDSQRDEAAFETVLEVFDEMAVDVIAVRPGLAFAPAYSAAKWAGGEPQLAANLVEEVALQTGAECQVGIADSLAAAILAAQDGVIVPEGRTAQFLETRPLHSLVQEVPTKYLPQVQEALETLHTLGVRTGRQLKLLGPSSVVSRFGVAGQFLWDLSNGKDPLFSLPNRGDREVNVEVTLDPPAATVELSFLAVRQASAALADKMIHQGLHSSTLKVELEEVGGRSSYRTWTLLDVTSSTEVSRRITWQVRRFADRIEEENVAEGEWGESRALKTIRLQALHPQVEPEASPLWGGNQSLQQANKAVSEVQALLGEDSVITPKVHGGFDPRTRVSLEPWGKETEASPPREGAWEGAVFPSPVVVFHQPLPAILIGALPGGGEGAINVDGRGNLGGTPRRVMVQHGHAELVGGDYPLTGIHSIWPIRGRWWQAEDTTHNPRCYTRVERVDGPDLLLVQRRGQWYVDGVYPEENWEDHRHTAGT